MKLAARQVLVLIVISFFFLVSRTSAGEDLFEEYIARFNKTYAEYIALRPSVKDDVKGIRKKLELFQIMQDSLMFKQKLFRDRASYWNKVYSSWKDRPFVERYLNSLHEKIEIYDSKIDIIGQHIRLYEERKALLKKNLEEAGTKVIPQEKLLDEKERTIFSLIELIRKEKNLQVAGSSPMELIGYRQQVAFLFENLESLNSRLGMEDREILREKEQIYAAANDYHDEDSENRIKEFTNDYRYRFRRQQVTDNARVKRIEDKGSKSEDLRSGLGRVYDRRLDAERRNIQIATE